MSDTLLGANRSDLTSLATWMEGRGLGSGPLENISPILGGTQNLMVRFDRDGRSYVMRRGPEHLRRASNSVILRETRVLRALAGTSVPHAPLIDWCEDDSVLDGAIFYLMEPVDGFNASQVLPALHAANPEIRRDMGFAIVDALLELGRVDHVARGLEDFGRPEGFLGRQVGRWLKELDSYGELRGYSGPELPGLEAIAKWIGERVPATWTPGLMHGDYHSANVMFSTTSADVAAIVDWEMATIGDPLLDLGWLVATWQLPDAPSIFGGPLMRATGLPMSRDLVDRYAAGSTRDVDAITWYAVLACFKLGILLEGTYARSFSGAAPVDTGRELHAVALSLFQRAKHLMEDPL